MWGRGGNEPEYDVSTPIQRADLKKRGINDDVQCTGVQEGNK
jgi:hypothetical protein